MLQLKLTRSLITTGRSRVRLKSTKGTIAVCSSFLIPSESIKRHLQDLQFAFRNPNCPPGTAPRHHASGELEKAYQKLLDDGFDPLSFWEQRICWGDQDSYQYASSNAIRMKLTNVRHVNNARMGNVLNLSMLNITC